MKQLVILSGKGGTGKTSIAASFAALAKRAVIVDADVDAADLHLLLKPKIIEQGEYSGGKMAAIDPLICTHCDDCRIQCRFEAIDENHVVDAIACEGCGVCLRTCPVEAVSMRPAFSGYWFESETSYGPFIHARLGIAAENSGKLVSLIREKAIAKAKATASDLILIDGSPGIGCPVIASATGCDLILCVTEPSLSGLHDLKRVADLAKHFSIPMVAAINKFDLNEVMADEIAQYCHTHGIAVVGRIPFDSTVVKSISAGKVLVEYSSSAAAQAVKRVWENVQRELQEDGVQNEAIV